MADPVAGYDALANAGRRFGHVGAAGIELEWIPRHASPCRPRLRRAPAAAQIGEHVAGVQTLWQQPCNLPAEVRADGRQRDQLSIGGAQVVVGKAPFTAMSPPGHVLGLRACLPGGAAFVHDTQMMPGSGSARMFPAADSRRSMPAMPQTCCPRPGAARAGAAGREECCKTTVAGHQAANAQLKAAPSRTARQALRSATLPLPRVMRAARQASIHGGRLPAPEETGRAFGSRRAAAAQARRRHSPGVIPLWRRKAATKAEGVE
ncbi:MBL fold metallo-hydrolase [Poseidonocella sp. HB161398]|uniref:MBL fold metallo-hydrolase n=1 Tax=Poseidonocella sp. HB161398 TaxID=2320855 RepID=UPI0011090001|nr:MBL fold metallo-hydrolase [Poseidonocella sp. HB161398]